MRLLAVEDDDRVAAALKTVLTRHGFDVVRARTAQSAMEALDARVDVVLLDLGLPDRDGFEVCSRIRKVSDVPIIIVTARAELRARIHGLSLGADDYLVKPYDLRELVARIHAVTRRSRMRAQERLGPEQDVVDLNGLRIDLAGRQVSADGRVITLTRKEFDVLALLAGAPGVVVRREHIVAQVWNSALESTERTLEVHVASLRAKLDVPEIIETVRGVGYRLVSA